MARFTDVDWDNKEQTFRASYSGGKDSTAMVIMLLEKGYPLNSIDFLDSEWEYPEVYEYLDKVEAYIEPRWGLKINRLYLKEEWKFERWFYGNHVRGMSKGQMRGFPRVLTGCYLSRQKGRTLDRYDRSSYRYIGIGWNERHRYTDNPKLLYPLIEWEVTEQDCIDFITEKGLYPTHNKYYSRSGCWWCPKQSMKSACSLYYRHPELWKQIKEMEKISPHGWNLPGRTTDDLEKKFEQYVLEGKINLEDYK